jgi:hypothetical protein
MLSTHKYLMRMLNARIMCKNHDSPLNGALVLWFSTLSIYTRTYVKTKIIVYGNLWLKVYLKNKTVFIR